MKTTVNVICALIGLVVGFAECLNLVFILLGIGENTVDCFTGFHLSIFGLSLLLLLSGIVNGGDM